MSTEEYDDKLPDALIAELRRADEAPPMITVAADREISALAAAQFSSRPERRIAPAWYAVAASVLVGVMALQLLGPADESPDLHRDVDGSGQIDIADVMALAMSDETISQDQLDAFAEQIVSLDGGS